MKITKSHLRKIIKEEMSRFLSEDEEGGYYVKAGSYGSKKFIGPDGAPIADLDGDTEYGGLGTAELVMATENIPGFDKVIDKEKLEDWKKNAASGPYAREGVGLYPDTDIMIRDKYFFEGPDEGWNALFRLYLEKVLNIHNPKIVEEPEEKEDDYVYPRY